MKFGGSLVLSSGAVAINSNWLFILAWPNTKQVMYVLQFKCTWVVHQLNHDGTAVYTHFFLSYPLGSAILHILLSGLFTCTPSLDDAHDLSFLDTGTMYPDSLFWSIRIVKNGVLLSQVNFSCFVYNLVPTRTWQTALCFVNTICVSLFPWNCCIVIVKCLYCISIAYINVSFPSRLEQVQEDLQVKQRELKNLDAKYTDLTHQNENLKSQVDK